MDTVHGARVDVRILDGHGVADRPGVHTAKAFDDVERFALRDAADPTRRRRGRDRALVVVVGRVDDERVSLPAANRFAGHGSQAFGPVRASVGRDDARLVDHLGDDDDVAGRLQNLVRVVVAGGEEASRHAACDAAVERVHELVRVRLLGSPGAALTFCLRPDVALARRAGQPPATSGAWRRPSGPGRPRRPGCSCRPRRRRAVRLRLERDPPPAARSC